MDASMTLHFPDSNEAKKWNVHSHKLYPKGNPDPTEVLKIEVRGGQLAIFIETPEQALAIAEAATASHRRLKG